jgi:hypothetical protein
VTHEEELKLQHPVDIQYSLLSCKVESLDNHGLKGLIEQAMKNTHADFHQSFETRV